MVTDSRTLRAPCLAAAVAWLLFAAVFMTVGGSAAPVAESDPPATQAGTAAAATADVDRGGVISGSMISGSIGRAKKAWSLRGLVNDLRQPRPPRQRSERPTTGADGIAAIMTASMLRLMLSLDLHRPYLSEADAAGPIAGHYRSLLRPPSALS